MKADSADGALVCGSFLCQRLKPLGRRMGSSINSDIHKASFDRKEQSVNLRPEAMSGWMSRFWTTLRRLIHQKLRVYRYVLLAYTVCSRILSIGMAGTT